jgi:hypothetical protein
LVKLLHGLVDGNFTLNMLQLNALVKHMLHICLALVFADETEQNVHILQRAALGLLNEEDDKYAHSAAEASKHDKGAPTNVVDGGRGDFGNDKVEQPLRCGGETNTVFTKACRENLLSRMVSM